MIDELTLLRVNMGKLSHKQGEPGLPSSGRRVRILLVEDEMRLAHSIEHRLQRAGYSVDLAFDGIEGRDKALKSEYELIVLDLNLPKMSGQEVLHALRAASYATPVLILSGRDKTEDRIQELQDGADDYLVKPFDSGELVARIEAILRRSDFSRISILQAGDLTVDVVKRTAVRGGKDLPLTPKEFTLLEYFLRNKNQILTRKRLAEQVWGYTFDTGTNIVDVYIAYLRKAIDEGFTRKLIQTVHGEGFMLTDGE